VFIILGPVLFSAFINDIFHFVQDSTIYNYADDNTLSYSDTNINTVVKTLKNDSINLIDWFSKNLMKANPDKFQSLFLPERALAVGTGKSFLGRH
jgi:hypothetical protein